MKHSIWSLDQVFHKNADAITSGMPTMRLRFYFPAISP
jgi:hypothetical protein